MTVKFYPTPEEFEAMAGVVELRGCIAELEQQLAAQKKLCDECEGYLLAIAAATKYPEMAYRPVLLVAFLKEQLGRLAEANQRADAIAAADKRDGYLRDLKRLTEAAKDCGMTGAEVTPAFFIIDWFKWTVYANQRAADALAVLKRAEIVRINGNLKGYWFFEHNWTIQDAKYRAATIVEAILAYAAEHPLKPEQPKGHDHGQQVFNTESVTQGNQSAEAIGPVGAAEETTRERNADSLSPLRESIVAPPHQFKVGEKVIPNMATWDDSISEYWGLDVPGIGTIMTEMCNGKVYVSWREGVSHLCEVDKLLPAPAETPSDASDGSKLASDHIGRGEDVDAKLLESAQSAPVAVGMREQGGEEKPWSVKYFEQDESWDVFDGDGDLVASFPGLYPEVESDPAEHLAHQFVAWQNGRDDLSELRDRGEQKPSRETLGALVRDVWIEWAKKQPNPKPSWLKTWDELSEADREVDRLIGERLITYGHDDLARQLEEMTKERNEWRDIGWRTVSLDRAIEKLQAENAHLKSQVGTLRLKAGQTLFRNDGKPRPTKSGEYFCHGSDIVRANFNGSAPLQVVTRMDGPCELPAEKEETL